MLDNIKYLMSLKTVDKNILNLCDGIIIPGGTDIFDYHYQIINYCIKNNIKLICLPYWEDVDTYLNKNLLI